MNPCSSTRRAALDPDLAFFRDHRQCSLSIEHLESGSMHVTPREIFRTMLLSGGAVAVCAATYFAYLVGK